MATTAAQRRRQRRLTDLDLTAVADALRVLAHPIRLKIVDLLLHERHSVGQLAEVLGEPQAGVSQHLSHLRARGVLDVERNGRSAFYFVIHPAADSLIRCIREHGPG
ncbi:MAG: ArsR/SmtB family transcription factor [Phycisphaeraceae bacterium]